MNVALQLEWTAQRFLDWAGAQEGRFEFDGTQPVRRTGGNARHGIVMGNLHAALRSRLRGTGRAYYGPDLGIQTSGQAVRYPDALITPARVAGDDRLAPDVLAVFEIISPTSGRTDRIEKTREYAAVASIRCYVTIETRFAGLLVLRRDAGEPWTAEALAEGDTLHLPWLAECIPVGELYEDADFADKVSD